MVVLVELEQELCHHKPSLLQASVLIPSSPHSTHTTTYNAPHTLVVCDG